MVIYKYDSMSDAFHAIQEISVIKDAEISFLSDKFIDPKDIDALDSSALPVESSLAPAAISSGEELMLHYKDRRAKGLFLSFPVTEGIVFRLVFFELGFLVVSVLTKTKICVDVPDDVEEILEKYGMFPSGE